MSENLSFVLRVTNKGYIDNYGDIEMIMEHVLKTTVDEFSSASGVDMKKVMGYICDDLAKGWREFSDEPDADESLGDYTLLEVFDGLSLLISSGDDDPDILGHAQYVTRVLTEAGEKLTWLKLFMGISVESLVGFLKSKRGGDNRYARICGDFCEAVEEYPGIIIIEDTTVGDVIRKLNFEIFKPWHIYSSIDKFTNRVTNCCATVLKLSKIISDAYGCRQYIIDAPRLKEMAAKTVYSMVPEGRLKTAE